MTNVWAYNLGKFQATSEWNVVIPFGMGVETSATNPMEIELLHGAIVKPNQPIEPAHAPPGMDAGINNLLVKLDDAGLRASVDRLSIIAHGESGMVYMKGPNNNFASPHFFHDFRFFVKRGGMIIFSSCKLAEGESGDLFLKRLSSDIPDRVIVGYNVWGAYSDWQGPAGDVYPSKDHSMPPPGTARLTPWGPYSKWVYNGQFVRYPAGSLDKNRCASPQCKGHADKNDRCPYATWGRNPTLLRLNP